MNMKRMRGRNHRPNGGGSGGGGGGGFRNQQNGIPLNRNHVFDSTGPEMRVRGTAQQLYDKYQQLARDASSSGDRVTGEAYYQHAEHYFRIISAINQAQGQPNNPQNQNGQPYQSGGEVRNGYQNNNGDYNRRPEQNGNGSSNGDANTELPPENRQPEQRFQEPRRYEQRPYEPRNKPEYPRPERNDRPERNERYRGDAPVEDTRIDISSALEAELTATVTEPAGFGEQPASAQPPAPVEARAIPIIPDAPPDIAPARAVRPRGRPKVVKPETE